MNSKLFVASILAAAALCACKRTPPGEPNPQSSQQVGAEARREAASAEAEMNKNAQSEDIPKGAASDDKKPDASAAPR